MSGPPAFLSCSEAKTEENNKVSERPRAATGLPHSLCLALCDDAHPRALCSSWWSNCNKLCVTCRWWKVSPMSSVWFLKSESHRADPIAVCKILSDDGAVLNERVKVLSLLLYFLKDISTLFRRLSKVIEDHSQSLRIFIRYTNREFWASS